VSLDHGGPDIEDKTFLIDVASDAAFVADKVVKKLIHLLTKHGEKIGALDNHTVRFILICSTAVEWAGLDSRAGVAARKRQQITRQTPTPAPDLPYAGAQTPSTRGVIMGAERVSGSNGQ
jgi:hypothetical protein